MTENNLSSGQRRKYPMISLEQAVERARVLYETEGRNPAPPDLIVQHWGFKSIKTGPASSAYSAVKQFGLIDETGTGTERRASVSQSGRAILTAPEDVARKEIELAALKPIVNRQVWDRFGANTGSDKTFIWNLVSEMGFSDNGAREFAKQYKATIQFARLADVPPDTVDDEEESEEESIEEPLSPTDPEYPFQDPNIRPSSGAATSAPMATGTRMTRHAIPLIGNKQVILEGEFPLTEAAWKQFLLVLEAFKPGLVESDTAAFFDNLLGPTKT